LSLKVINNHWDESLFEEWDENRSNLGYEGSRQLNIDIIWVDSNIDLGNLELWSKFGRWGTSLGAEANSDVEVKLFDIDVSGTCDCDTILVRKVTGKVSL